MQNNKPQESLNLLVTIYYRQTPQYQIIFRHPVHTSVLKLMKQQTRWFRDRLYNLLYEQISGISCNNQKYFCQSQNNLIQIIKNISSFGGLDFLGHRYTKTLEQQYISLKLTHIQNITFTNLKMLNFTNSSLNNIKALQRLDIKNLRQIWLNDNQIVTLKPFSKTSFSKLSTLVISTNYFQYHALKCFQRSNLPKLNYICTQQWINSTQPLSLQDLRILIKSKISSSYNTQKITVVYDKQINKSNNTKQKQIINQHSHLVLQEL